MELRSVSLKNPFPLYALQYNGEPESLIRISRVGGTRVWSRLLEYCAAEPEDEISADEWEDYVYSHGTEPDWFYQTKPGDWIVASKLDGSKRFDYEALAVMKDEEFRRYFTVDEG